MHGATGLVCRQAGWWVGVGDRAGSRIPGEDGGRQAVRQPDGVEWGRQGLGQNLQGEFEAVVRTRLLP